MSAADASDSREFPSDAAPAKSRKGCLIRGIAVVVLIAVGLWLGSRWLLGRMARLAEPELAAHPIVQEHLGELQSVTMDLKSSAELAGNETFVFQLVGSKGTGSVAGECNPRTPETGFFKVAVLRVETGETFSLFPLDSAGNVPQDGAAPAQP